MATRATPHPAAHLALVALLGSCRTDRPPPRVTGPEAYPIVLAHGLAGFRRLAGVEYFFQVPETLQRHGFQVAVTTVPPWGPVETRARVLGQQVDSVLRRTGAPKVHLVAHSMGGLDGRYAISRLGYGDRVASLTTVGTPHRGTPLADGYVTLRVRPLDGVKDLAADFYAWTLGSPRVPNDHAGAVRDLAQSYAAVVNEQLRDDPRVRYYSFAGRTLGHDGHGACDDGVFPNPAERDVAPPELVPTAVVLSGPDPLHPVANDGLVTVASAKWGLFMGCLPANHLRQVGQPLRALPVPGLWDHRDFYLAWAQDLVAGTARRYTPPLQEGR
jgi:triacylglycerol lipase